MWERHIHTRVSVSVCGLACVVAAAPAARSDGAERPATADRPSILFAIADDWSWPHAGAYGDKVVQTPTFDRVAREGVLFTGAFCAAPSCTASRGAILTGQAIHRLEAGGNLWSYLPSRLKVYPDLVEAAGYVVGYERKGWGPGRFEEGGRTRNPAGPQFKSFAEFFQTVPADKPFCFWFGSTDPHRAYEKGSGLEAGMTIDKVVVPAFLPDTDEVRRDILDYYFEVQRFDREVGEIIRIIEDAGRLDNTIVVMTSDNGMPFPRCKANLYEYGTHLPLAIRWPAGVKGGRVAGTFVEFTDYAPTFLEAAGLQPPSEMTGKSLLGLLTGRTAEHKEMAFLERERHANARPGNLSYPCRAVRTKEFLFIRNFRPDRWPAGDPDYEGAPRLFGDIDGSPTKELLLNGRDDPGIAPFFGLACEKRPAEELYDLVKDPGQLVNVAAKPEYAEAKQRLRSTLERWMKETGDPRATTDDDRYDKYPYFGQQQARRGAS